MQSLSIGTPAKETILKTTDKMDKNAKPHDLRDGLVRVTVEDHQTVFDSAERDGGLVAVTPDSKEPPGQTTRE